MASQGCNLLLVLKEHLKDLYGLTASRISGYSPNDTSLSKANERQVNRRANVNFKPKATIAILKQGDLPTELDDEQKADLVSKYLEVSLGIEVFEEFETAFLEVFPFLLVRIVKYRIL